MCAKIWLLSTNKWRPSRSALSPASPRLVHIAVLLQHYHTPDCATAARPWSLVKALSTRHTVTVLTTCAWYQQRLTNRFAWTPPGVRMHMLDVPYSNTMTTRERFRSYLSYAARALWTGARLPRPDLIYASSTPLTVAVVGAALAARWRCPWIFEVRDLWPDFPVQMGALQNPLLCRALYALEHVLYRRATRVVAASPEMAAHVRRVTDPGKVFSVAYGTDFEILRHAQSEAGPALNASLKPPTEQQVILYAGSFGRANDLPTLVEAARLLQGRRALRFVFAGRGHHRPLLERAARRLPNVCLLGPLPYPESLALFQRADLSLVPFLDRPVLRTNAPSKFFDSLAAGTPVIVTNPGWTKGFVERHQCGWYAPPEQPGVLARCIEAALHDEGRRHTAARNARRAARVHFDRAVHMNTLLSIIETLSNG